MIIYDKAQHNALPIGSVTRWLSSSGTIWFYCQRTEEGWVNIVPNSGYCGMPHDLDTTAFQYPREVFLPDTEPFSVTMSEVPLYRFTFYRWHKYPSCSAQPDSVMLSVFASTQQEAEEKARALLNGPPLNAVWEFRLDKVEEL